MQISIRQYIPADKEVILSLLRLNTPAFFALSEEKALDEYLDNHSAHYFVVESDGRIIGSGGINFSDDMTSARISWDIIHPEFHGKGVGSNLVRHRLEKIKEFADVRTIVVRTSHVAFGFYEKQGFVLKKVVKDYWADGYDLYYMELKGG